MPNIKLIVDESSINNRIDSYLAENTLLSRSQVQKLIEDKRSWLMGNQLLINIKQK